MAIYISIEMKIKKMKILFDYEINKEKFFKKDASNTNSIDFLQN